MQFGNYLICPTGFDCSAPLTIYLICCSQTISVSIPLGADAATRSYLINQLIARCQKIQASCGGPSSVYYLNKPQTCVATCSDGTTNTFTVVAGTYAAPTLDAANAAAYAAACAEAVAHQVCLGSLNQPQCCLQAYSGQLTASGAGASSSLTWSAVGGLPSWLTLTGHGTYATLTGTPTATGTYTFTIATVGPDAVYSQKQFSLLVQDMTTDSVLPDAVLNGGYSEQIASGGYANPVFTLASGSLPTGITLSSSGLLSGTPTVSGVYSFVIQIAES